MLLWFLRKASSSRESYNHKWNLNEDLYIAAYLNQQSLHLPTFLRIQISSWKAWYHLISPDWSDRGDQNICQESREQMVIGGLPYHQRPNRCSERKLRLGKNLLILSSGSLIFRVYFWTGIEVTTIRYFIKYLLGRYTHTYAYTNIVKCFYQ